jgi:hypothetical protein
MSWMTVVSGPWFVVVEGFPHDLILGPVRGDGGWIRIHHVADERMRVGGQQPFDRQQSDETIAHTHGGYRGTVEPMAADADDEIVDTFVRRCDWNVSRRVLRCCVQHITAGRRVNDQIHRRTVRSSRWQRHT